MNRLMRTPLAGALAFALCAPLAAQQTVTLPARDTPLQDRPADVFRIGAMDGADWEMFAGIRAAAFDADDNLYLLDGDNVRVLVFDARGRFVRQFGSRGGGPGEFQFPMGLAVLSDGSIAVSDLANRAYIVFTPAGEHSRNISFDAELGLQLGAFAAHPAGGIVSRANPGMQRSAAQAAATTSHIFRHPLEPGSAAVRLYDIPVAAPRVIENSGTADNRRIAMVRMDPVFGPRPLFGVLPDGSVAIQNETEYAVRIVDSNGRVTRVLARAQEPRRVTQRDRDAWQERQRDGDGATMISVATTAGAAGGGTRVSVGGGPGGPGGAAALALENVPFAEFMAVVTGLRADPQGRLWVQRRDRDGTDRGPIDLITAAGRYVGTLPAQPLPDAVSSSGLAAYVERDELGVEYVAVRRLPDAWR